VAEAELLAEAWREAAGLAAADGLLAVIAPEELIAEAAPADDLWDGVPLLTPRAAKGLEFDHVVVVEPALLARLDRGAPAQGLRELYVALTRPTRTLVVLHARPLPDALAQTQ
jgi:superfamily I DNA/RNA helicase